MKQLRLLLIALFSGTMSYAQVQVCLGTDATVCQGSTVQITNCGGSGGGSVGGVYLNAPNNIVVGDDSWGPAVPMGFTFNFYGTNYTQCVIGANGIISFNLANANGYCPWSMNTNQFLPPNSGAVPHCLNTAMVAYQDLNPANFNSGPIQYQTLGTAPNRQFVVLYNGVTMFSCTNSCAYIGYIFYEGTNVIEMFIGEKGQCSSWNSGLAAQGTCNNIPSPNTTAHITPGRNFSVWTASQDGRRWTPTAPSNTTQYTITQIPYVNINAPGGNLQWQNTFGQTFPYNNGVLNITQVPPGTTGYFLTGTSCGVGIGSVSDTTYITRVNVNGTTSTTTDYCSGGNGTATVTPTVGLAPFQFAWAPGGQTTQTATGLVAGTYQVVITDANGCSKTLPVTVPNSGATFIGSSTLVTCPGGSDGTATATMTPVLGTITYNWYDAGGQTTQTATGLVAGTYHCEIVSSLGCVDTVEVIVSEIPPMVATVVLQQDPSCNSGSDGTIALNVTGGSPDYTYSWDNSSSIYQAANDLAAGTHTVTITDYNGCVITSTNTLGEPLPLAITSMSTDDVICPESSTTLSVTGTGGSTAKTFTWTENGAVIGTGSSIVVDPSTSGTVYCVTLSEACGSPTTDSCLTITFPTEIIPAFVPDKTWSCQPGTFVFENVSNIASTGGQSEIESVLFDFGDGNTETLIGAAGTTHTYENPGAYTLSATITSIYGCVTYTEFPGMVSVIAKPTADFVPSSNPTTIFETTVVMQDKSSPGVISWEWTSPGSVPAASTSENPVFKFPDGVEGNYPIMLVVETPEGCVDTVEHILIVNTDILFFAPNAFTPDGDEFNQTWKFSISGVDEQNFELLIFNRWGEVIWETHDIHAEWDGTYNGKTVPAGSYSWTARVKSLSDDFKNTYRGSITILPSR